MRVDGWRVAALIGIAFVAFLVIYYFLPLIDGLAMGVVFSYVAKPLKRRMEGKIGGVPSSLISTILIIVPIAFLMFYGLFQGLNQLIYALTHKGEIEGIVIKVLRRMGISERYVERVREYIPTLISFMKSRLEVSAIKMTEKFTMFLLNFTVSAIVCYYVLLDGEAFVDRLMRIVPEDKREGFRRFVTEVDEIFVGMWFGNFIVAILIGLLSIPYFLYFKVPLTPLLSGLMFLAALIPIFAEWMIVVPVAFYIATKNVVTAVWFLIIGLVFFYILPEIIIRPHIVGYTSRVHPLVLMLAFIGGAIIGGVAGFFIAPMIAGLATAIYSHYTDVG